MAVGDTERVVIYIDPDLKRELYAALALDGKHLKDWFIENAHRYLQSRGQAELAFKPKPEPRQ